MGALGTEDAVRAVVLVVLVVLGTALVFAATPTRVEPTLETAVVAEEDGRVVRRLAAGAVVLDLVSPGLAVFRFLRLKTEPATAAKSSFAPAFSST